MLINLLHIFLSFNAYYISRVFSFACISQPSCTDSHSHEVKHKTHLSLKAAFIGGLRAIAFCSASLQNR